MISRNALPTKLKLKKIIGKKDSSLFYEDDLKDNSNIPSMASLNDNTPGIITDGGTQIGLFGLLLGICNHGQ